MTQFFIISEDGSSIEIENNKFIDSGGKALRYGEFIPPLKYNGLEVSKISFTKFRRFDNNKILLCDSSIDLDMSIHSKVELKLFPVPGTF